MKEKPVLATILRAGLPLHQGLLNYFDSSDNAFISAYRKHKKGGDFEIKIEYMASPDLAGKTLILCDPMLASGSSMILAMKAILTRGTPKHIHIVSVRFCATKFPHYAERPWCRKSHISFSHPDNNPSPCLPFYLPYR